MAGRGMPLAISLAAVMLAMLIWLIEGSSYGIIAIVIAVLVSILVFATIPTENRGPVTKVLSILVFGVLLLAVCAIIFLMFAFQGYVH